MNAIRRTTTTTTTETTAEPRKVEVYWNVTVGVPSRRYMLCDVGGEVITACMAVDYSVFGDEYVQRTKAFKLLHKDCKEYYPGSEFERYMANVFGDRFDELAFQTLSSEIIRKLESKGITSDEVIFLYKGEVRKR